AVFGLHPFNVDSVAWVAERKNVLSTFFWLLTIWAYSGYVYRGGRRRYLLMTVFFTLGLLAKPMLVTLPFVMLLLDYWPLGRFQLTQPSDEVGDKTDERTSYLQAPRFFRLLREKIPLFILSAVCILFFSSAGTRPGIVVGEEFVPMKLRIANALVSYVSYIAGTFWPRKLAVFYPYPDWVPVWQAVGACLLLAAASSLVVLMSRRKPYLVTGWLWYVGTLLPVIGLLQAGLWPAMADRWAYVPLIGLFVIIAWGADDLTAQWGMRKSVVAIPAGVCLSALIVCTWWQVGHWRNGFTLFSHALEVTNDNYIAHYNLGNILLREERTDEAIAHYKSAVSIHKNYVDAHYNLGITLAAAKRYAEAAEEYRIVTRLKKNHKKVLSRLADALAKNGQLDEALSHYDKALAQMPDDAELLNNFALALVKKGKIDEAVECYNRSLAIEPGSIEVLNNLGNALVKKKQFAEAVAHYRKALSLEPRFAETHYNLANALKQMGEIEEAIVCYRGALELKPDDIDAHYGLGLALAHLRKYDEAAVHYGKAIELNPGFAPAYYNLGIAYVRQNMTNKAIEQFREVLRIHPNDAEMHCNLGILLAQEGQLDEAIEEFRTALRLDPSFARAREQLESVLARRAASTSR
ncbi:MAG: tetratricopeptide repeat protein, partial [Planctomycetota bacterium]